MKLNQLRNPYAMRFKRAIVASILALSFYWQSPQTSAATVTVQDVSTYPRRTVNIDVAGFYRGSAYAGVVNLLIDGQAATGFCIDPYHFASRNPLEYTIVNLEDAPKSHTLFEGDMGGEKADQISKLWAMAYLPNSPTWGHSEAAALQLAIWEIVAGDKFTVTGPTDYGARALLSRLNAFTGQGAKLTALTGPGQDYVTTRVPEAGATLLLLSLGIGSLALIRRARK